MLKGLGGRVGLGVTWRFRVSITQLEGSYRVLKHALCVLEGQGVWAWEIQWKRRFYRNVWA